MATPADAWELKEAARIDERVHRLGNDVSLLRYEMRWLQIAVLLMAPLGLLLGIVDLILVLVR